MLPHINLKKRILLKGFTVNCKAFFISKPQQFKKNKQ